VGGRLFFAADDGAGGEGLWGSDGSSAGTALIKAIEMTDEHQYTYGDAAALTAMEGRVFFSADDGTSGDELWTSNGTEEGTVLVRDINPCEEPVGYQPARHPSSLTPAGSRLFFAADDDTHGEELWMWDSTTEVTDMVKDIRS
jgi:ELWxxDGT repeat protein